MTQETQDIATEIQQKPLIGNRVVIVCDNLFLAELFEAQDRMWENYIPGEFLHIVEEITEVTLTPDQMLHQERMSNIFSGRKQEK